MTPGSTPAMKSCAIDTSAITPYTIMMIDGGIRSPSVPAPASEPIAMSSGYPRRESSGRLILPIVAQVAALEPDTAAKIAHPTTLVCSRRPGSDCIQGARPRNMSWLSRVRNRISPIQTNNGNAVRVQLDAAPQVVTAIASPAGLALKSCMPIHATPDNVRPIQTPLPRMRNRATIRRAAIAMSFMRAGVSLVAARFVAMRLDSATAQREHEFVDQRDGKDDAARRHR